MIFHVLFLTLALGTSKPILAFPRQNLWHWFELVHFVGCSHACLFFFYNLATAAALFYLAELVEEYTVLTAKVIKGMVAVSRKMQTAEVHTVPVQLLRDIEMNDIRWKLQELHK